MVNSIALIEEVRRFVKLQVRLLQELTLTVTQPTGEVDTLKAPRSGSVVLDNERWSYFRHGSGVLFTSIESGARVDVSDLVELPTCFDAWRLGTYFRSLGRPGHKLLVSVSDNRSLSIDNCVEILLAHLVELGLARQLGHCLCWTAEL